MADFYKAFEAIDVDGSGEITVEELQQYMMKNNYKENFVTKWLKLFDDDNCGKITYKHYCDTLGLVPRDRPSSDKDEESNKVVAEKDAKTENSDSKQSKKKSSETKPIARDSKPVIIKASETHKQEEAMEMTVEKQESQSVNAASKPDASKGRNPKSYPIQSMKKSHRHRKTSFKNHKRHLRASIQPGVILILLAGHHKGKRVIFLRQLSSGLLLVTGPLRLNGCPLRRVHQRLVIATATKIDIGDVIVPDRINDSYFTRDISSRQRTTTDVSAIFVKTKKEYALKEERKEDQVVVDRGILAAIKVREDRSVMVKYLRSPFSLSSHDCPHSMTF